MDIRDALAALAPAAGPPPPDVVAADLERGRRAVVRRRRRLQVAGATLGVAAVLGLTATVQAVSALGGSGALTDPAAPPPTTPPATAGPPLAAAPPSAAGALRLVPPSGPSGGAFTPTLVPEGWSVLSATGDILVLAPPGTDAGWKGYNDKIVISLGIAEPGREPAGAGRFVGIGDGVALEIDRGDGTYLAVQFPPVAARDLTDEQMLRFAAGVAVGPDAVASSG